MRFSGIESRARGGRVLTWMVGRATAREARNIMILVARTCWVGGRVAGIVVHVCERDKRLRIER